MFGFRGFGRVHWDLLARIPKPQTVKRIFLGLVFCCGALQLMLGNLKQPHPTSSQMVVYIGSSTKMALNWELKVF